MTAKPIHRRARSGLLRSYQVTSIFGKFTVLENAVLFALGSRRHAWGFWRPMLANARAHAAAENAVEAAGLTAFADRLASELAYKQRRQRYLAMALAASPKFLLLDDPMAGMSVQESAAVTALLRGEAPLYHPVRRAPRTSYSVPSQRCLGTRISAIGQIQAWRRSPRRRATIANGGDIHRTGVKLGLVGVANNNSKNGTQRHRKVPLSFVA